MIVRPDTRPTADEDLPLVFGAALVMLSLELAPLGDLRDWPPVGGALESFADALRGHGGMSVAEVRRLRAWSARWSRMRVEIRGFYARHAPDPAVTHALRRLLDGGPDPSPGAVAALYRLWRGDPEAPCGEPPGPLWYRIPGNG